MDSSWTVGRRGFLAACAAWVASGWLPRRAAAQDGAETRPNIILFLVDDMGWQDTSVPFWTGPTPANRHFRTPNMERLAKQGIRFTNAHAHPVCSPTRTSIMTGWNPARHHVTNWTLHPERDTSGDWGPLAAPKDWNMGGLQPPQTTLPGLLHAAGYFTIHCGKAHWGAQGTPGENPCNLGFDINIAGHAAGAPASYQGLDDFGNKEDGGRKKDWAVPGLKEYHGQDIHLTDALTIEAGDAMERAVASGKPFYLYMAHYAVHTPIQPHQRFMGNYADRNYPGSDLDIPEVEEKYASMVEGMDASLGALLDRAEALGVAENTLVIFTSDNGGLSAHARETTPRGTGLNTHNWPLKAGKGSAYEGGTRVPFIAAWTKPNPQNAMQRELPIAAQSTSAQPIISEDLFPTVLGIAGAVRELPVDYPLDGRDIRAYLMQRGADPERPLLFHYPHVWGPHGPGYEPHSSLTAGKWKAIYFYIPRRWELYDLEHDLEEKVDLAAKHPEQLETIAGQLKRDLIAMGAQWPIRRDTGEPQPLLPPKELAVQSPGQNPSSLPDAGQAR